MKHILKKSGFLFFFIFLISCSSSNIFVDTSDGDPMELIPPSNEDLVYRVFLIGDAGAPSLDVQEPTLKLFQSFLEEAGERSTAVFLGDNIYSNGLPDSTDPRRDFYEARIIEQMKTVKNYEGKVFFIPGNHDWDDGGKDGLEEVNRQEKFVEAYLDRGNTFLPDNGFPGPIGIKLLDDDDDERLREDIRLIILDTQWWLHEYEKPYGDTGEYELYDSGAMLTELDDILKKQRNDFLLIAAHHPLFSNGAHGGYMSPSKHFRPPVFGSLYMLYRRIFGFEQDLPHYEYKEFANTLKKLFNSLELEHLVYASGHSHSLQYHKEEAKRTEHHYLVSGAGSKSSYVAKGRGAEFTYEGQGFMTLQYYADGSVWLEAWAPEGDGSAGKILYRNQLKEPYADPLPEEDIEDLPDVNYTDSTVTTTPNLEYDEKGAFFRFLAGDHNRGYWSIPVEFPVFDVTEVERGLTPVRLGGKGQSNTVHLEREDGRDFVLRSVNKEAGKIWDEELRKTIALDLAQDQFSILNPYAALLVPDLADAVKVYHTNPKIYYVPKDPRLGKYADDIGGELALFEERPNGEMSDVASVGNTEEVLSHAELLREIDGDIDHRVDQQAFARARLLDMLIADWDRHSDQWRWASFEPEDEKGKIYVPIPRDRDVAFMNMTGVIPTLSKLGSFFQYQNFDEDYGKLRGLNFNSLALTRRFTNQITREEWLVIAQEMQAALSDEVIETAVQNYPAPVFQKYGEETTRLLKIRRDKLVEVANENYNMISEVISIQGSNKREKFEVKILDHKQISVKVYKLSGDGELREKYYDRVFDAGETKELRLIGMDGDDEFMISGKTENPTKMIIVGGSGNDYFSDDTPKEGWRPNIEVYDTQKGNELEVGSNTKIKTSDDPLINFYDYKTDYKWDRSFFSFFTAYNNDDGIFLGGGPEFINYNFRKHPAKRQFVRANYAPKTGAANLRYTGWIYDWRGDWDANLEGEYLLPKSYKNFFGLGNETTLEDRKTNYYRARLTRFAIEPRLYFNKNNVLSFYGGAKLAVTKVDGNDENIVNEPKLNIPQETFSSQWFASFVSGVTLRDVDDKSNPKQGYQFSANAKLSMGVENTPDNFSTISSDLRLYFSARFDPQITFANRTGFAHNIGAFPFYESNTIGGTSNLRGYRGHRFSGRTSFYNNAEVRVELFDFYRYLLGGKVGLTGFTDVGKVWINSENSRIWHAGYGGGIWFNVFESFLVNSTLGFSKEGTFFEVKAGFLF